MVSERLGAGVIMEPEQILNPGDRVRGVISGKYMGIVVKDLKEEVTLESPDKDLFVTAKVFIEPIPAIGETGEPRVWVV